MTKIIVIGCPGSGKSTLTFKLVEMLNYPVLHLDKIYHIDNDNHISRAELMEKVEKFANEHENWIIDGNYISSIEQRIKLCNTVILLDLDTSICVNNAIERTKKTRTADMAEGFDNSKLADGFIEYIENFKTQTLPKITELLDTYKNKKQIYILRDYKEIDEFVKNLSKNKIDI